MFQFYLSSIKRRWCVTNRLSAYSFNSTLVQLKGSIKFTSEDLGECFNSTLVQLKVNGLIPAFCLLPGFNSTLVQLKVTPKPVEIRKFICFNSTLVQLKDISISVATISVIVSILP